MEKTDNRKEIVEMLISKAENEKAYYLRKIEGIQKVIDSLHNQSLNAQANHITPTK